jgi:hypothetical protein
LCVAKAGNVADELNEPVFQHFLTSLVPSRLLQTGRDVRFVPEADIQAAFGYYCWWARVLKFVEHHP